MRRKDREITDFHEIVAIMQKCQVCRLALNNGVYPYIVPMNFGMTVADGTVTLYFHCAREGTKLNLIAADPHASFEMECETRLASCPETGDCTMTFKSVIGQGVIEFITDTEEKIRALDLLVSRHHPEGFAWDRSYLPATTVFKLTVESMNCKFHPGAHRKS